MAADAHHSPSLLAQPASIVLLGTLAVSTLLLLISGHHGWVGALVGTVVVGLGMGGLQLVTGGQGHHGHDADHGAGHGAVHGGHGHH